MKKIVVLGLAGAGLLLASTAYANSDIQNLVTPFATQEKNIEHDLESITNEMLGDKKDMVLPEYRGGSYGGLEDDTTPINIRRFDVTYQSPPPEDLKSYVDEILSQQEGQTVPLKDLVENVKSLEESIVRRGYPMVRVVLPAQELSEKESSDVQLEVVSGYLDNIDVEVDPLGLQEVTEEDNIAITNLLQEQLSLLQEKTYLTSEMIDRQLLLVKEKFGIYSELFLRKGERLGAFDVVIRTRYRSDQSMVSYNNGIDKAFGNNMGRYVYIKNDIGEASAQQLRIAVSASTRQVNTKYYRSMDIEKSFIDLKGHKLAYDLKMSRSANVAGIYQLKSQSQSVGVKYTIPYLMKFKQQLKINTGLDIAENQMFNVNSLSYQYKDKAVVASIGTTYTKNTDLQRHRFDLTLLKGLDSLGAKTKEKDGIKASKEDVKPTMKIVMADYMYERSMDFGGKYRLEASGQYTNGKPVLSSQSFSVTGVSYRVQGKGISVAGDEGWVVRNTLNLKEHTIKDNVILLPYVAVAYGEARRAKPTAQEEKNGTAASRTVGLKTYFGGTSLNVAYSIAKARGKKDKQINHLFFSLRQSF